MSQSSDIFIFSLLYILSFIIIGKRIRGALITLILLIFVHTRGEGLIISFNIYIFVIGSKNDMDGISKKFDNVYKIMMNILNED